MRNQLLAVAASAALLCGLSATAAGPVIAPLPLDPAHHACAKHGPRPPAAADRVRANPDFDVLHIDLELGVDPAAQTLDGLATLTMECLGSAAALDLDLVGLAASAVEVDGAARTFSQDATQLHVDGPWVAGETYDVAVAYGGAPTLTGWGGGFVFAPAIAYTFTEPDGTRHWIPCIDDPAEKATLRLAVTAPDDLIVAGNGLITEWTDLGDGTARTVREHDFPVAPYLIAVGISDYEVIEDEWQGMPLHHYAYPSMLAEATADFAPHPHLLDVYSALYGLYPFETYGVMMAPMGGAMEHQTRTTYGDGLVDGNGTYTIILAHELAHHWWGDKVTCATWDDIWLNEGFATWSEAALVEWDYGFDFYLDYIRAQAQYYIDWIEWEGLSPLSQPNYMWGGLVYDRGSVTLHMLRMAMGDADFFLALDDYQDQHAFAAATTDDLEAVLQAHTQVDIEAFFDQWVHTAGHPVLGIGARVTEIEAGVVQVDLAVEQLQTWPGLWTFELPVLVGDDPGVWIVPVTQQLELFSSCRVYVPGEIAIDPDYTVLKEQQPISMDDHPFVDVCSGGGDDDTADDDTADDDDTTDDDDTADDDDTGAGDDDVSLVGGDGCQCRATGEGRAALPLLVLLGVLLAGRRRVC